MLYPLEQSSSNGKHRRTNEHLVELFVHFIDMFVIVQYLRDKRPVGESEQLLCLGIEEENINRFLSLIVTRTYYLQHVVYRCFAWDWLDSLFDLKNIQSKLQELQLIHNTRKRHVQEKNGIFGESEGRGGQKTDDQSRHVDLHLNLAVSWVDDMSCSIADNVSEVTAARS